MADNTIIQSGTITRVSSTVLTIPLRSGVDWMRVYNQSNLDSLTTNHGTEYYWQRGMTAGLGWVWYSGDGSNIVSQSPIAAGKGFTLVDSSVDPVGGLNTTITDISNAAIPVVTNTAVNGLVAGDTVRLSFLVGATQLGGFDFTVGNNTLSNTTFSLDFMAQIVTSTTAYWRKIATDPLYYPTTRSITKVTIGATTKIQMSVTHGYTVGQKIRLKVSGAYGMVELNNQVVTITDVTTDVATNEITVAHDSTGYTAFVFPVTGTTAFSPAMTIPLGEAAELDYANLLDDATTNTGYIGMKLGTGDLAPGGISGDKLYWTAGKSFNE